MAVLAGKGGASTQIQSNLAPHLQSGMCLRLVDDGLMAWGGGSELHGSKQDSQVPSLSKVSRSPARSGEPLGSSVRGRAGYRPGLLANPCADFLDAHQSVSLVLNNCQLETLFFEG
ncbi:hypothetical protein BDA96_09G102100 [Sorghum bicolor]|uniref:Uncharacterized protein n=2 Tax=Sorghum bicolor TaxID=4558 RepID=A0A921U4F4_SORBI|nr:hypothetical protein BDA96_09G102100 [Sorghum bicolor]KAG0517586.1 hypothetical protein BDA96_09G102100 [Sorghum bicolor]KXG21710.1 hypothetical protein SORBI_3009G098300 [Sorghum bicolor]